MMVDVCSIAGCSSKGGSCIRRQATLWPSHAAGSCRRQFAAARLVNTAAHTNNICCALLSLCMCCVLLVDDRSPRQYQHVRIYIFLSNTNLVKISSCCQSVCVSTIIYTHMLVDSTPLCTHMNACMIILPIETCSIQHCSTKGAYQQ
jgi:hypothetical protein